MSIENPRVGARVLAGVALLLATGGCRQDMHDAPRYDALEKSSFYADGRSARDPMAGTVARGHLNEDTVLLTGRTPDGKFATAAPMPLDLALLQRGQERFNIFCSPCHDRVGTGNGMIVRRGYKQPQTYHSDRLRDQPLGYFVDVMSNGFGQMPSYAHQVPPRDRWAIAAYIRALQYSQNARLAELSADDRQQIAAAGSRPAGEAGAAAHGGGGGHHQGER